MTEVVRIPTVVARDKGTIIVTWSGLDADDSGQAVDVSNYPDKSVHIYGTQNGVTVTLWGSNDPRAKTDQEAGTLFGVKTASWVKLTDTLGNDLAIATNDALKTILENPQWILPVNTGGGGSTAMKVVMVCSRNKI